MTPSGEASAAVECGSGCRATPQPECQASESRQIASEPAEFKRAPSVYGRPDVTLHVDVASQVRLAEGVGRGRPEQAPEGTWTVDDDPGSGGPLRRRVGGERQVELAAGRQCAPKEGKNLPRE